MVDKFLLNRLVNEPNQIALFIKECFSKLSEEKKPIVLFGAGIIGTIYLQYFKKYKIADTLVFCDNRPQKQGALIKGIPIISFDELKINYSDCYIVITSLQFYSEIEAQLRNNNLAHNLISKIPNIILSEPPFYEEFKNYLEIVKDNLELFSQVFDILSDELSRELFYERINYCITADNKYLIPLKSKTTQYFEPGIIKLAEDEIFIDGGAYTGDTAEAFLKQVDGAFRRIYSFEPETSKHKEFLNKFSSNGNVELVPYGLWNKKEVLRFSSVNSGSSRVNETGNIEIPVISIDEFLDGKPVTFIKMDIEGAELEALRGAANSIRKYRPKLAICVYHKPLDIVKIPLYLKELVPEYKIYLRHYNSSSSETVCYAVAE